LEGAGLLYQQSVEGEIGPEASAAADALLDSAGDWADIADVVRDHGFTAVREAQRALEELLGDVYRHGLFVYGRRVVRTIKGGMSPPAPLPVMHLMVLTESDLRELGGFEESQTQGEVSI
jgi:hypothetical protein